MLLLESISVNPNGYKSTMNRNRQPSFVRRSACLGLVSLLWLTLAAAVSPSSPPVITSLTVVETNLVFVASFPPGVERAVYTSTVGCIGFVEDGLADETSPVSMAQMTGPYKQTKFEAEQVALRAARDFEVVIVNPTAPVGERDWKPTPTGKTILDFLKGKIPAFVDTGLNVVDVRECALGHVQALERGRRGERYILGSENLHLREILGRLAAIQGRKAPAVQIPYFGAYVAGWFSTMAASLTGREPDVPLDAVKMAKKKMFASSEKARRELGYVPTSATPALARAVQWFEENGYV